jgi:hypothetical protein
MRLQQLAPQIVPIPFRHCWFAAESRRNPLYTYDENALADVNIRELVQFHRKQRKLGGSYLFCAYP